MTDSRNFAIVLTLTGALLLPFSVGAATDLGNDVSNAASTVGKAVTDTAITTQVKALLALESDIKSFNISVTTKNGVVYLQGRVDTGLQSDKAVELAQSVNGVKDVDNSQLRIKQSDSYARDAFITAKVKGTILQLSNNNKINSANDLHVETTNGAVHIFGTVGNGDDVDTIKKAVSAVGGVKSVNTDIDVK